jgi:hypothetical protein
MVQVRPMAEVASVYDQRARTYETVENTTRDLAATVLRQYSLLPHRTLCNNFCMAALYSELF